ncbi:MAG: branched-chain amino acid ABC transporter permease [Bdellovibrionales bacterium CG10_big_fil_rev_8_21_14_0_10_45_34]|nr:MAG: branched-chain amino acid ABC transporter permease [Bdellovibrionales bacterium CG10_big_fil_rev_8_21_14_0_10_45_34]
MIDILQHLINGLSLGSIYALIALGYTMVFGILKLINFAHGEVYMLGAFFGYYSSHYFGLANNPSIGAFFIAVAAAMVGCTVVGFTIERLAYRPLRNAPRINVLITAVGVSLLLQFSGQLFFGSDPKFFPQILEVKSQIHLGALQINPLQLTVFVSSVVLMSILQFVIFHTRLGRAMRAVSFNHETAMLMGINTDRVISYTFMLGSSLAGAAGVLVGIIYPKIEPLMGVLPGLKAFVAAVLGGIGNILGAVVGALILGLSEEFVVAYGSSTFRDALAFSILILVLLFKPEGLFGANRSEKV